MIGWRLTNQWSQNDVGFEILLLLQCSSVAHPSRAMCHDSEGCSHSRSYRSPCKRVSLIWVPVHYHFSRLYCVHVVQVYLALWEILLARQLFNVLQTDKIFTKDFVGRLNVLSSWTNISLYPHICRALGVYRVKFCCALSQSEVSPEEIRFLTDVNQVGVILASRLAVQGFIRRDIDDGYIVNINR